MTITYGITVSDEIEEIQFLMDYLISNTDPSNSEFIILRDIHRKGSKKVGKIIDHYSNNTKFDIHHIPFKFNHDFSEFKNTIQKYAEGDWIFQIDADEYPTSKIIGESLENIIEKRTTDIIFVPRLNIITDLNMSLVKEYGWRLNCMRLPILHRECNATELETYERELLHMTNQYTEDYIMDTDDDIEYFVPIINFPDLQSRIYKNSDDIKWTGKVHETIISQNESSDFHPNNYNNKLNSGIKRIKRSTAYNVEERAPYRNVDKYCLIHKKDSGTQRKQNEYYSEINK